MDREKVIKGLECCTQHGSMSGRDCNGHWGWTDGSHTGMELLDEYRTKCPYGNCETGCVKTLTKDALALLKAQEPRVLTLEEVRGSLKQPIWKEVCSSHKYLYTGWVLAYDIQTGQGITGTRLGMAEPSGRVVWYRLEDYGTKWRCWDKRPTEEQREAVPWNLAK